MLQNKWVLCHQGKHSMVYVVSSGIHVIHHCPLMNTKVIGICFVMKEVGGGCTLFVKKCKQKMKGLLVSDILRCRGLFNMHTPIAHGTLVFYLVQRI